MTLDPFNAFLHLDPQPGDGGPTIGVKDVIDVAGMPTTAASRVLHRMPDGGRRVRRSAAGCGRDHRRQGEHPRVRLRRAHDQPALRPRAQSVESRACLRRLERGQRRRSRCRLGRRVARHGHGRFRAHSRRLLRRDGHAANLGPRPDERRPPDRLVARHRRPARVERRRVRAAARDDGGAAAWWPRRGRRPPRGRPHEAVRRRRAGRGGGVRARARRAAGSEGARRAPAPRGAVDDHAADHAPGGDERAPALAANEARRLRRRRPCATAGRPAAAVDRVHDRPARASLGARGVRARPR